MLGWQVRRLRASKDFKIVGVVGSIGKTSTKLAIAKVLAAEKRVRWQEGNYNDILSVPLVFFGHEIPTLWNVFAWLKIIFKNELQIWGDFPYRFVVLELGTDAPGQIAQFRKYLHLDIAVVTAISPEHMEFFESLKNVAEEEWSVSFFSGTVLANKDLCTVIPENLSNRKIIYYGKGYGSNYKIENVSKVKDGFSFDLLHEGKKVLNAYFEAASEIQLYSACAAVSVAKMSGISDKAVRESLGKIKSFAGRMQKLSGIKNSVILDDTYNASPDAVKMALDTLYGYEAPQRIAILGMMNELGKSSRGEHEKVGNYCNPKFLDLVVTIGRDANAYIAPAAREKGCEVLEAKNSEDAGILARDRVKEGAVILAKGSQNGVFAEEALKPLLAQKDDISRLVRQGKEWINRKRLTFV